MRKQIFITGLWFVCLLLTTGWTDLFINVENGTSGTISVSSSETGKEIKIKPASFKRLLHDSGDLTVTTQSGAKIKFSRVVVFDVDEKYLERRSSVLGPGWVTLNVVLETNMQLYVLTQDQKAVKNQPDGYPKLGQELSQ